MLSCEQSKIVSYFKDAIKTKSVRHAYILSGEKGLGKKHLAKNVCLAFACEKNEGCGVCNKCRALKNGADTDVIYLASEGGKEYGIDAIRDLLTKVYKKPNGEYKLIVFTDAHLLNVKCQNALLKTIEEPPPYAVFIFVCENKLSLLPTVRSRSLILELHPWKKDELKKIFSSTVKNEYLYDLSEGNPQKLLNMSGNPSFEKCRNIAIDTLSTLVTSSHYEVYNVTEKWLSQKEETDILLSSLLLLLRDVLFFIIGQKENLTNVDKLKDIQNIASKISEKSAFAITEIVSDFIRHTSKYDNLTMALQTMFMRIKEEIND